MANGFSSFRDDHHYASGMILTLVGVVVAVGGITGTLAAALAALWTDPNTTLYSTAGLESTSSPSLNPLEPVNPLNPLGPIKAAL